ncbi:hypothetical protein PPL_07729 [Heterostelium album PN500]|uniref:Saposin B-type domain-containing protein n=1 Tax=Heterostelium pallidum (strain ATCC 26659 / Pp 5 / PN500) TaxID=670386 RepID=D3BGS7_HETP5|nr:hypothetical protein PPL_07729 [Heterostelium album PN500]EFA79311.1 hypothetical protein PPL_07729 [Heterostelium album PN500]|eukprot:XP_020431432.1 hypothetical protein PPL_07729 [Heterostelium album PN500]
MKFLIAAIVLLALIANTNATTQQLQDTKCDVCTYVVKYAEELVMKNETTYQIVHQMTKACHMLPSKWQQPCNTIVESYGPLIIVKLINQENPNVVCAQLQVCTPKVAEENFDGVKNGRVEKHHFPIGHHHHGKKVECKACEWVASKVEHAIVNGKSEHEAESWVDKECDHFEISPAIHICKKAVHSLIKDMVREINKHASPNLIKAILKIDFGPTSTQSFMLVPTKENQVDAKQH